MSDSFILRNAALLFSQSVHALGEIEAMRASNQERAVKGLAQAYDEAAFVDCVNKHLLGWNDALGILNGGL